MRITLSVAVLAVVVLAGCSGTVGSDPATDTVTAVEPPETTSDPPAAASPDNTLHVSNLTAYQRAAFRAAKDGGAQFVPNSTYVDESEGFDRERMEPFRTHEFVRENGTYYRITFEDGQLYATYGITATVGTPSENDTVVALADLPEPVRDEARQAVTEGQYYAPYGKWDSLPESLRDAQYIRCRNETYRMRYVVGDNWARLLTVQEAS